MTLEHLPTTSDAALDALLLDIEVASALLFGDASFRDAPGKPLARDERAA